MGGEGRSNEGRRGRASGLAIIETELATEPRRQRSVTLFRDKKDAINDRYEPGPRSRRRCHRVLRGRRLRLGSGR